ncbi:protein turtle homolog B-like isoform X2 [Orbicella faveolata]|nr:protein turtle homolog B-like isoform X2 [Orbicella faveolata]XP_020602990.1 protein turtle homolog B-like isoform X2 [Orbicella faveolata]XP_020602991.1 protein turtle homolog B-like isoform X2 [Orbicella faveolata]
MFWCFLWIGCFFSSFQRGLAQGSSSNTDPGGGKSPPLEIAVKLGSDAIIPCDAVDPNQPSDLFEWRKNGSKSAIFIKFMNFKPHIDSRYSRRLHMINSSAILLSGAKESDSGIYRCRTMQTGSESTILKHGRWVVLKVTGKAALPSRRKTVVEKYPAVLDCLIDSNLPSENVIYSWTKNGADATSDARATIIASGALFIKSTRRTDSGVYMCTAKTFDSNGLVNYPGTDIMLDVQFTPTITDMPDTVAAPEGSDARLPCVSVGNPSTHFTNWTRHGESLTSHPRFAVLEKGSLLIQNVRRTDAGEYVCTPHNKVGAGMSKTTKLVLKVVPKFIVAPPSIMTLRVGDDVSLVCEATSESPPKLTWEREGMPFPADRTDIQGGKLVITAIQKDDYGVYTCIATSDDGKARHSTTIAVISTPSKPTITSVHFNRATAVVKWRPGYDGGYPQQLEVWYRLVTDNDYEWRRSAFLLASVTSYNIPDLQPEQAYYFSIRGINREGAGHFSDLVEARGVPPKINRSPDKADKPLAPQNVIVNITKDGYYITWTHTAVPGRPEVEKFVVEYREGNGSSAWLVAAAAVPEGRRVYLFEAEMIEEDKTYDFRVFAFGANEFSDAAYVSKTYKLGSPVIGRRSGKSDVIPIIAGVLGALVGIFLLGLVCFCFIHRKSRKENISKSGDKKVHFTLPDGSTEAYEPEESDEDFLDAEIKLRPEAVRFIPDDSDGSEDEKFAKLKREEDLILTGHDGRYSGDMLRYAKLVTSASPPRSPENSSEDEKVHYFGDLESRDGQSAWYDCTLAKPASREVRDSFDQFCKSDVGSRDSILSHKSPPGFGRKASFEHLGSQAYAAQKFGSNHSLPDKRDSSLFRNPRFQPIQEELPRDRDVPRGNATLGRRQPHHWSTPAVFSRRQDSNNNSDGKGSDSDSGDSSSRGRKGRRHRPHSLYEGKLRPISEQDSDSKLRCTCDDEEESDEGLKYPAHKGREGSGTLSLGRKVPDTESSYLHLERADSQRLSFTEQLKGWSEASLKGEPYDKHSKNKNPVSPLDTDSENSVSPALSMVSLSETESDREIARNLYDSQPSTVTNGSLTRQTDAIALPRAVTKLRSVDSESSSDEQGRSGVRDRSRKPSPPVYKDKKPPSVTDLNLNPMERADSMDQLKICDPFFQQRRRVSRSSSNASSGICSVLVSSSETNSIESPRESSSKRSSRSSDRTSSDRASSGYGSSRDSYDKPDRIKPADYSKAHAQMRLKGTRLSPLDDPYELDPSSSEMDDLETEGTSYNPQVFEDLMTLQQEMGVNLEGSDSSRESLKEMEKLSNSDLLRYSPNVSPTKYKVDQLSDAEKDQRCSKLMAEYKTNKKLQDVKASGSQVYRSWDL